jgi:nucleoside-diphosphate-sugar epimerase
MDVSKLKSLGWEASISLKKGLELLHDELKFKSWND